MAYTPIPKFSHGDQTVSAANMNLFGQNDAFLATALAGDHLAVKQLATGETASMLNTRRWLHYMTIAGETGTITDPAGAGDNVSLTESDTVMLPYDLSGVSWLDQGQVYNVTGVQYVAEDSSA